MKGIIVKLISDDYTVLADKKQYICKARGKFRNMNISPVVGDEVIIDSEKKIILEVLPRKNELLRPPVSNVDQGIIITSLRQPNFDNNLLDKLLTIIEWNNIKPIIIFTKVDLVDISQYQTIIDYYKSIGYNVYLNKEVKQIKNIFKNKVSVFAGQSGAGKSTLLNNLNKDLNIKTGEISLALNRGKHTTRHVELLPVAGGLVADTPGFSAVEFVGMTNSDIRDNFIEFNEYRNKCKYRDCMHDKEDGCMIKEMVKSGDILKSRYENYLNFIHKG